MNSEGKIKWILPNGTEKWVTKREYNAMQKKLKEPNVFYDDLVNSNDVDPHFTIEEQVRQIVDCGVILMGIIGTYADNITINGYQEVKKINKNITKSDWIEMVSFMSKHLHGEKIDEKKITEKQLNNIDKAVFSVNFKNTIYSQFSDFKDIALVDEPKNVIWPKLKFSTKNDEFKKILMECAKFRYELDNNLWPIMKGYADAVMWLTNYEIMPKDYKKLVDYQYYTGDEDKRFQKIDKRWEALVNEFTRQYTLCSRVGYTKYFEEIEQLVVYKLLQEGILDEVVNAVKDYKTPTHIRKIINPTNKKINLVEV